ncbi:MAG: M20 family metallopeptidase [Planctomycetaceae bacterium]|nr:M20 family metallopeptidase [Planctomycetaceae bacterium]
MTDPVTLLKSLVAIPSVNPMGRSLSGDQYLEARLTDWLVAFLKTHHLPCEVISIEPGRANVLTRIDAPGATKTVLFDAHQDTVPVDGMTIPPFEPMERDGRIYGRGSCDVKGGLAAMLSAFLQLAQDRPAKMPNVVFSMTCDEEATSLGINHMVASWKGEVPSYRLLPKAPDVAIVAEPTLLDIVVAHRGAVRWKIVTRGRACHSSRPKEGINAIYRMAEVVRLLEQYAESLPGSRPAHPLCGPATLSVGLISGGSSVNVVPDYCEIDIDRRLLPGETGLNARSEIIGYLAERLPFEVEHLEPYCLSSALGDDLNSSLASELMKSIRAIDGEHSVIGVPYGTHASRIAAAGIPAVVFGPGDIAQAHTKDEWIEISQLHKATDVYYHFASQQ